MAATSEIHEFIGQRLEEDMKNGALERFTMDCVWDNVSRHQPHHYAQYYCDTCYENQFPCRYLRETAATWSNHPDYQQRWKL